MAGDSEYLYHSAIVRGTIREMRVMMNERHEVGTKFGTGLLGSIHR